MASAARSERSLHPSDRAAAIYGICAPELVGRRMTIEGRRVQALAAGRFGLLASYVDRQSFSTESIAEHREDGPWLAELARVHERAVERIAALGAVVPARPLTFVADAATLPAYARERAAAWAREFGRFRDARECALHLYAGPHRLPFAQPYLVRVSGRLERSAKSTAVAPDAAPAARELWDACVAASSGSRRVATTGERAHLGSIALQVAPGGEQRLAVLVAQARDALAAAGIAVYVEAPRAPYSFV